MPVEILNTNSRNPQLRC